MHLLRSASIGTEIIDDSDHSVHGVVSDLLIDPDNGKIIALFVLAPGVRELLVLQTQNIITWGKRIHIRDPEVMGPLNDFVRLEKYLEDDRTVTGQKIRTKSGNTLGVCKDVQFSTKTFDLEWIFPRKFLRKGIPLPVSDILEVTDQAIIVKDQGPRTQKIAVPKPKPSRVQPVISPAATYTSS